MDVARLDRVALAERPRLLGIAYRIIGSYSEAEDVVQDAMVRVHRAPATDIASPAAYLTTITTRLAIDHLRSARVRRESYVGPWLPEPIVADPAADAASKAIISDSLSMGFLVLLERCGPSERAVLVLHDVFAYSHAEIGAMLHRSEASSRQLLRRARQRMEDGHARAAVAPGQRDEVTRRFIAACDGGDFDAFLAVLVADVELIFDGGAEVKTAARRPIRSAARVARFMAFAMTRLSATRCVELTNLNGGPAALIYAEPGRLIGAVFVEPGEGARAALIRWVRNPSKLQHLQAAGHLNSAPPHHGHRIGR